MSAKGGPEGQHTGSRIQQAAVYELGLLPHGKPILTKGFLNAD